MLKYGKQKNPWGYTLFAIALILSFANWLLLVLYTVDIADIGTITTIQWDYNRFILVSCGTYLVCSVLLECIYFRAAYTFVFESNASLDAGIYGFVGGFVRPFFYGLQILFKKVLIVALLIWGNIENVVFYQYALPLLLEVWMFWICFGMYWFMSERRC